MSEFAAPAPTPIEQRELILTRIFNVPRAKVYRAWTEPKLVKQWFAPAPWTTSKVEFDLRPGGTSLVVMRSPQGQEFGEAHEQMGFHQGWGQCADRLAAVAAKL